MRIKSILLSLVCFSLSCLTVPVIACLPPDCGDCCHWVSTGEEPNDGYCELNADAECGDCQGGCYNPCNNCVSCSCEWDCTPTQSCCNDTCCNSGNCCNGTTCCPNSDDVCCTDSGDYCCNSGETCCDGTCCNTSTQKCCDDIGGTNDGYCCNTGQECCEGECCDSDECEECVDGACEYQCDNLCEVCDGGECGLKPTAECVNDSDCDEILEHCYLCKCICYDCYAWEYVPENYFDPCPECDNEEG